MYSSISSISFSTSPAILYDLPYAGSAICSVQSKQKRIWREKTTRYEVTGEWFQKHPTGVGQALVVSDAELAKECFNTSDMVFATRPKALAAELMGYNYATFGLGPYGDYWRTMHKMVMIEVLSQRRVEMLTYIRLPEVRGSMKNIYEACVILTGGIVTTHATLTSALSLLLNNPKALQMAQEELDVHVGKDRLVEESDITNLVYLQAIMKETMRLHPPALISPARESMDNCIIAGYNIPKGTRLMLNTQKLHRDHKVWSDPNQFLPKRFLTSHKDTYSKGQQYEYLPFGCGRRMCPGAFFCNKDFAFYVSQFILQGFVPAKPSKDPVDISENVKLTTNMKDFPCEVLLSPSLSGSLYYANE
ncbi:cytochrome P450 CYP82D47-like protein [Tanacetum coccineum]|uniref:Cytochrome P450 CYP82D47-like protein n=1 Tax=Tanacetum coccineum TaxID=301880 RepID=A0ABQ4XXG8_9ASTR